MHDSFYEQVLPVKLSASKQALRIFLSIAAVILFIFLTLFVGFFGITLGAILIYFSFFVWLPKFKMDYEYSLTNSYLQIAAIYNKESRKDQFELDLRDAEIVAPAESPRLQPIRNNARVLSFTSADKTLQEFSIILKQNNTTYNVIIQPDDKLKKLIKNYAASRMYLD